MNPTDELAGRWRRDAELLERYGDERGARVCRLHAEELEQAQRAIEGDVLTLAAAAAESGYSSERLRHMVASGEIPNAGRRGAPRVRRGDLPTKAKRGADFDAAVVANRVLTITKGNT